MGSENSRQPTGYPPVTETEEEVAERNFPTRPVPEGDRLGADGKVTVDEIAGVFQEHRAKVDKALLDPEPKRYVLELLDTIFLDVLQTILSETSAVEVLRSSRANSSRSRTLSSAELSAPDRSRS